MYSEQNIIFFGILFIVMFYIINEINNIKNQIKNIENFDSSTTASPAILEAVKQVYQADIEAIRNLSSFASQLTTSGYIRCPGSLNISNGSSDTIKMNPDGSCSFANGKVKIDINGNITTLGTASFANTKFTVDGNGSIVSKGTASITDVTYCNGQLNVTGNANVSGNVNLQNTYSNLFIGPYNTIRQGNYGMEFLQNGQTPIRFKWQYKTSGQIIFGSPGENKINSILFPDSSTAGPTGD